MNSLGKDCNELKRKYDACFNSWFTESYLNGKTDDSACKTLFKVYQECVKRAMKDHKIDIKNVVETEFDLGEDHLKSATSFRKN